MGRRIAELPAEIRPHIKVHKSPELARLQVEAGAIGLSCATVWEAIVLVRVGARPHLRRQHRGRAAQAPGAGRAGRRGRRHGRRRRCRRTSTPLSAAARAAGSELGVLVEIDTGMDRCGADTPDEAVELARRVVDRPGLRLLGITGYEGHCSLTPDHDQRLAKEQDGDGLPHRHRRPVRARGPALPDPVGRRDRDLGLDRRVPRRHRDPGRHVRRSWTTSTAGWSAGSSTR